VSRLFCSRNIEDGNARAPRAQRSPTDLPPPPPSSGSGSSPPPPSPRSRACGGGGGGGGWVALVAPSVTPSLNWRQPRARPIFTAPAPLGPCTLMPAASAPGVSTPLFHDKNTQHIGKSQSKRPHKMWKRPLTILRPRARRRRS
jgi:hypothetical protein